MKIHFIAFAILTGFFLNCSNLIAQIEETKYVYQTIIQEQKFELNSSLKTGGRTRSFIKINLPPNTVHWFYMITIKKIEQAYPILDLSNQIATKVNDPQFQAANLAANLFLAPDGTAVCDVFLTDKNGKDMFMERGELNTYYTYKDIFHDESSSRLNFSQGVIRVDNKKLNYLVFRNNSSMQGIKINIQIVAKVKKTDVNWQEWSSENKEIVRDFYDEYFEDYEYGEKVNKWIAECVSETVFKKYSPELYFSDEIDKLIDTIIKNCEKPYKQRKLDSENAKRYDDLASDMLQEGKIEECMNYSQQALSLNSNLSAPPIYLSICYLIKENQEKAQSYLNKYLQIIQSLNSTKEQKVNYLKSLKQKYRETESKYNHVDANTVMHMINNEIEKYQRQ